MTTRGKRKVRQFYNFDYSQNFNGDLKKMATDVLEYSDIHLLVRGALVRSFVCHFTGGLIIARVSIMIVIVEEHSFMRLFMKLCSYNNIIAILA